MSKARIMGAGSSGYNYGVNKNSPGNGNGKWQGLWPSVGHARNARHINIEAGGNNRNVVFCMNQLAGVGRISTMFATTADGVKDCKHNQLIKHGGFFTLGSGEYKYNLVKLSWKIEAAQATSGSPMFKLIDDWSKPSLKYSFSIYGYDSGGLLNRGVDFLSNGDYIISMTFPCLVMDAGGVSITGYSLSVSASNGNEGGYTLSFDKTGQTGQIAFSTYGGEGVPIVPVETDKIINGTVIIGAPCSP